MIMRLIVQRSFSSFGYYYVRVAEWKWQRHSKWSGSIYTATYCKSKYAALSRISPALESIRNVRYAVQITPNHALSQTLYCKAHRQLRVHIHRVRERETDCL
jgi:hypothetical protein